MARVLEVEAFCVLVAGRRFALPQLALGPGECAALFAPSGTGKSTLLRGLFSPSGTFEGRVRVEGLDFGAMAAADRRRCLRTRIAFVAQDAIGALDPFSTLSAQVGAAAGTDAAAVVRTIAGLSHGEAEDFAHRLPHAVSGGQAQRALFATAALRRPALVVADEPTANLDDANAARVAAVLQDLREQGVAVLLATHDERLLRALGPTVLVPSADGFRPGVAAVPPWPARAPSPEADAPVRLAARGLCVRLGDRDALAGIDLEVRAGEVVAVLGPSGCGKTTLLRALCGRVAASAGTVTRPQRTGAVQLVGQDAGGSLTPGRSVRSLVAEVATAGFDLDATAAQLGLAEDVLARTSSSLSGGERRRAALLRALAVEPSVLLLDEPTASLDRGSAVALVTALLAQRQRGVALVVVTHDEGLGAAIAHRVLRLQGGTWQTH